MTEARVRVVLQSRLSSSRLPAKGMLTVAGRPVVALAAQRAGNAGADLVVATSDRPEDDLIVAAVHAAGAAVVRGPLDDPLGRFCIATRDLADDDIVLRLTADNVLPDGELVDFLVRGLASHGATYARIGGDDPDLPFGVTGEVFTAGALRRADQLATGPEDREHVTPWLRREHGDLRLEVPDLPADWAGLRCTIDTFDDYVRVAGIFHDLPDPVGASWRDLCQRLVGSGVPRQVPVRDNPLGQGPLLLGTVQLGVPYGAANTAGLPDAETAADVLDAIRTTGITHLDTARAYGIAEDRIGIALRRGLSEHVGVITKVAPLDMLGADADPAFGDTLVEASVQRSLRALGASSVDALLVHRAADWDKPGVRDALTDVRDAGLARMVGVSLSTPTELLGVLSDPDCGYVQLPFNLLDRRWLAEDVQAALATRPDVIVTARSAYLQGLLVAGEDATWPANAPEESAAVVATIDGLVRDLGRTSRADLCLAYVLGHPWVTSVVAGAGTSAQVRDSATLITGPVLSTEELAHVREQLAAGSDILVDPSTWQNDD